MAILPPVAFTTISVGGQPCHRSKLRWQGTNLVDWSPAARLMGRQHVALPVRL